MNCHYKICLYARNAFFLLVFFSPLNTLSIADELILVDGKKIEAENIWMKDDNVYYQKYGVVVILEKSQVLEIKRAKQTVTEEPVLPALDNDKASEDLLFSRHEKTLALNGQIAELEAELADQEERFQAVVKKIEQMRTDSDPAKDTPQWRQQWEDEYTRERDKTIKIRADLMALHNRLNMWEEQFSKGLNDGRSGDNVPESDISTFSN